MTRQPVVSKIMQVFPRHAAAVRPARAAMAAMAATTAAGSLMTRSPRSQFVCPACQHQQRQQRALFSSTPAPRQTAEISDPPPPSPTHPLSPPPPPPPPPRSGYARLTSRRLISIGGVDAPRFLQGIVTQSLVSSSSSPSPSSSTPGFYSGFLNATGRVLHDVFIYPDVLRVGIAADDPTLDPSQAFLIEVDAAQVAELVRHLRRYMLRSKLKVRALEPEGEGGCAVWQVWDDGDGDGGDGGGGSDRLESLMFPPSSSDGGNSNAKKSSIILRDDRAPGHGYRVLSSSSTQPSSQSLPEPLADRLQTAIPNFTFASDASYRVRRYLSGVAEGQAEIPRGDALPLEANLDLMGGIDFRKGCYVGQELTIRTKHRGVVRKRILPCALYDGNNGSASLPETLGYRPEAFQGVAAAENIPADLQIGRDGKKGRSAGNWLGGVGNVGLALCRLQTMTDVQLPGEAATAPFDPSHEFVMRWGGDEESGNQKSVKVKAFVPGWLRRRLDESYKSHGSSASSSR